MSRDTAYLLDILDSSRLAVRYLSDADKAAFFKNLERQDAVIRRLLIVGEAARRVSEETRRQLPDLPWSGMIAMRNFMIHEYDDVDLKVVWDTVHNDLPPIIEALEKMVV